MDRVKNKPNFSVQEVPSQVQALKVQQTFLKKF
jgi:hypothetical protein